MPIVALICPDHPDAGPVAADHFGPPPACTYVPRAMAARVLTHADTRPDGWTVTELLGCVRERLILKHLRVAVDPAMFLQAEMGSAWHAWLEAVNGEQTRYEGRLLGLPVSGMPDLYNRDAGVLADYKKGRGPSGSKPRPAHEAQLAMYAELIRQNGGEVKRAGIWYANDGRGMEWREARLNYDWLRHEVDRTGRTVADVIEMAKAAEDPRSVPCQCGDIFYGRSSKRDRYCPVADVCRGLDGQEG